MKTNQKNGRNDGGRWGSLVLGVLVLGLASAVSASAQTVATVTPTASKSWLSKTFGRTAWREVAKAYETPREICRVIDRHVRYVSESQDQWAAPEATWARGRGDCEDFAIAIQELCRLSGIPAEVHLYFPAGVGREGHAVLVGEWNGKIWFSSNGTYEEVKSEQDVRKRVASMLSCKEKQLWGMKLSQRDVAAYLDKAPARPVAVATR